MLPTFSLKFLKTFLSNSGIVTAMLAVLIVGISALAYQVIQPPPPKTCGSPGGPAVTAPRIKLGDGRHLAYKEHGVPKDNAKYKIFFVHGFDSCRHDSAVANFLSPVLICWFFIFIFFPLSL